MSLAHTADPDTGLPPLLMVHGLLVTRRLWEPNAALSRHFRRICVDLPAHGDSPAPKTAENARPYALVRELDMLRQQLGIERWHVCGQSFGAGLVLHYALEQPCHTGGVVFTNANAALRAKWSAEAASANATHLADIARDGTDALRCLPYHPAHARRFPHDLREALTRDADATDPGGFALLLREGLPRLSVHNRLRYLHSPTLLVNGVKERKFQLHRDWLAQTHPAIRIVDLQGGHSVNVDCAEAFNAALCSFLAAVSL